MTHVTCRLTAKNRDQLRNRTLGNRVWATFLHAVQLPSRKGQILDAFHQKCLRQLLGIRWYDRVGNDEVLQRTGLTSLSHLLSRRRISVFGHVARLDDVTPANVALQLHINVSLHRPPDLTWRRPPGRPRTSGSTSYETIPPVRLESSGGVLSTVDMVVQRRDGPRRLRDHDDDDKRSD